MNETDTQNKSGDNIPLQNTYPLYEYPDYTFDKKYDNDEYQKAVISLDSGYHLVLAPPGCGKTDILAERVARAMARGIKTDEMLCLTFTNRAARGMRSRITDRLNIQGELDLFVGNVHRFCSHFLFDNGIISRNSTVLEAKESSDIIQNILSDSLCLGSSEISFEKTQFIEDIAKMQHILELEENGCKHTLLPNLDLFNRYPFKELFRVLGLSFSFENFAKLYNGSIAVNSELDGLYGSMLNMILAAWEYRTYKQENNLLDFDDLLITTYIYGSAHREEVRKYKWIQIDEVQDLSPFQFAIIDIFTEYSPESVTVYLGDEQQAIFSFIGAKLATLEMIRKRCGENMHRLYFNYRSPKYLLDIFNTYANMQLDVDPCFLPTTQNNVEPEADSLGIIGYNDKISEVKGVAEIVRTKLSENPEERVAVLVPWNKDANAVSACLNREGIGHFKISGDDLFTLPDVQFLFAHLQVLQNETNLMAWSRLMTGMRIFSGTSRANATLKDMKNNFVLPTDLMRNDGSSYMLELMKCCMGDYVIYDTETTGLNVFEDDIVQIAAMKVHDGFVTDKFNILLKTEREIPKMLGDIENPLIAEYQSGELHERSEGLNSFLNFCGSLPLIGHNVEYDYNILDFNLKRDCRYADFKQVHPVYFDTLKAARIMEPRIKKYKLKYLLEYFKLEGENSHLADDDVVATKSVLDYLLGKFREKQEEHISLLNELEDTGREMKEAYAELYASARKRLYIREADRNESCVVEEIRRLYENALSKNWIKKIEKLSYIINFFEKDVINIYKYPSLKQQLEAYLIDILTYREADLCESSSIEEKVFISTVHKAKGLEFESVIVFESTDGVYPFFAKSSAEDIKESARLFYVALSRAKKRLYITYCESVSGVSKYGNQYCMKKEPTPFLRHIKKFFH